MPGRPVPSSIIEAGLACREWSWVCDSVSVVGNRGAAHRPLSRTAAGLAAAESCIGSKQYVRDSVVASGGVCINGGAFVPIHERRCSARSIGAA
jgi:hypothetical protein